MANGLSDRKADKQELMEITEEAYEAASQLLAAARPKKGSIFVVGCSTSEVGGERIGSFSSPELGQALFDGIYRAVKEAEVYLAAQCCEHLNRALILEEEAAECYGYEQVNVVPQPKAGGSLQRRHITALCIRWQWSISGHQPAWILGIPSSACI